MKRSNIFIVFAPLLMAASNSAFALQINYQLGIGVEENVARAVYAQEFHKDWISEASLDLSSDWSLNNKSLLTVSGNVATAQYATIDHLSWYKGTLKTTLGWQPGRGYLAPWYQFSLKSGYQVFGDDHRNHWFVQAASQTSKRITDRILLNTGLSYQYGEADNTVFDRNNIRWFLNADYSLFNSTALYSTYSLDYGYVWTAINLPSAASSTATAEKSTLRNHHIEAETLETISPYGDVYMHDYALNDAIDGDWYAYRAYALNQTFTLGVNQQVSDTLSLDLSYQYLNITNESDKTYNNQSLFLTVLGRF
jgi:hypothetical protein